MSCLPVIATYPAAAAALADSWPNILLVRGHTYYSAVAQISLLSSFPLSGLDTEFKVKLTSWFLKTGSIPCRPLVVPREVSDFTGDVTQSKTPVAPPSPVQLLPKADAASP